jgi:uncharacterized protein
LADALAPVADESTWTKAPWGLVTALVALLVSFLVYVLGGTLVLSLDLRHRLHSQLLEGIIAYQALMVGVVICVVFLRVRQNRMGLEVLGFRFPGWGRLLRSIALLPVLYVGVAILTVLFNALLPQFQLQGNSKELLGGGSSRIPLSIEVVTLLWAAIEAPLVEEVLFRGIIYQGLRSFFVGRLSFGWSVFLAAFISGTIFAVFHFEIHTLPILALFGMALAYVFQSSRSIYTSALLHGLNNGIAVLVLFHPK